MISGLEDSINSKSSESISSKASSQVKLQLIVHVTVMRAEAGRLMREHVKGLPQSRYLQ